MLTLEFRAMNTSVLVAVKDQPRADVGLKSVREFIGQAENRFSRFIPESEVCRLNKAAGAWFSVSWELMELLRLSRQHHEATRGLFDPSVLPDLLRAGYVRSMDAIKSSGASGTSPSTNRLETSVNERRGSRDSRPAFSEIELDTCRQRVRLPAGMAIDLGGIAKGWIVEKAATLLSSFSSPCAVSAGGDIFFVGRPEIGSRWPVGLEDPFDPTRTIAWLCVDPGAVVTSSVTKRTWNKGGVTNHHIIDPRTGQPARTTWLSTTVVAPDAPAAEAYAKALLVGGRDEALRLQLERPELAFVVVDDDGRLHGSDNSKEFINVSTAVHNCS